jgi:hypothetical protein
MIHINFKQNKGTQIDFSEWSFEDGVDGLDTLISKALNDALSIVFSENGARALIDVDIYNEFKADDLFIDCEILIDECEVSAFAKFSLRELIEDAASETLNEGDTKKMADALRAIADTISTYE